MRYSVKILAVAIMSIPASVCLAQCVTTLFPDKTAPDIQRVTVAGEFTFPNNRAPEGLSGIAWLGGSRYAMCGDSGGLVYFTKIAIDTTSGVITGCVFTGHAKLSGASDLEGIAADIKTKTLYLADETGPSIFGLTKTSETNTTMREVALPAPLRNARSNRSLESLSFDTDSKRIWTATEDSLPIDGHESSTTNASLLRIYAFPVSGSVEPEPPFWTYALDKAEGSSLSGLIPAPFNGLSDICALGDGRLLTLERNFGYVEETGQNTCGCFITIAIYLININDQSPSAQLQHPIAKKLLWRGRTGIANYEGICIGPKLADGSRVIILVADGDISSSGSFSFQWAKALLSLSVSL